MIPKLAVYTTYILPSGGLYATYHLLGEPETTIESSCFSLRVSPPNFFDRSVSYQMGQETAPTLWKISHKLNTIHQLTNGKNIVKKG